MVLPSVRTSSVYANFSVACSVGFVDLPSSVLMFSNKDSEENLPSCRDAEIRLCAVLRAVREKSSVVLSSARQSSRMPIFTSLDSFRGKKSVGRIMVDPRKFFFWKIDFRSTNLIP